MIELIGHEDCSEFEAARTIRDALIKLWPGIDATDACEELVKIATGVKISGYRVSDIDVVVCARLRPGRKFLPKKVLTDKNGARVSNRPIAVPNLIIVIEVKDQDASGVRFLGDNVEVKYSRTGPVKWKSATDQNINQVHSLRDYFSDQHIDLFVHRLLILRGLNQVSCNGTLPRSFSGSELLTALASATRTTRHGNDYILSSGPADMIGRAIAAPIFRRVTPSALDRKRMDRIAARNAAVETWQAEMGSMMLRFRGRGGTGKTIVLLQMAWRAYEERGARTLFLTYNRALAADIRRLMALMGVQSVPDKGGIAINTVMSFMFSWFSRMQLPIESENLLINSYEQYCSSAIDMLKLGSTRSIDVASIKNADPGRFDFDYIAVDEAQDWPINEVELLKSLYGSNRICLADGVDQLIRGSHANWERSVPEGGYKVIPLRRCLRMKANLAVFANEVARRAGLNWHVEPNDEAGGGRVILITESYAEHLALHRSLLEAARKAGNAEIDFLFCVPPSDVSMSENGRSSLLARTLCDQGFDVWDGTNELERQDFPRGVQTYRVVQYASCRGLEGWTVIAEGLDEFYELRRVQRLNASFPGNESNEYKLPPELAEEEAWRWCLIPLTRPIDTLVISLKDANNNFSRTLIQMSERYPDIIERVSAHFE